MSDYAYEFKGRGVYTPNGKTAIADVDAHNAAIETRELELWTGKPDRFLAYYAFPAEDNKTAKVYRRSFMPLLTGAKVSTWRGIYIGRIIYANVYPHNFGGRMVSVIVSGNNGATYYGRASYDNGECIWLRKGK